MDDHIDKSFAFWNQKQLAADDEPRVQNVQYTVRILLYYNLLNKITELRHLYDNTVMGLYLIVNLAVNFHVGCGVKVLKLT